MPIGVALAKARRSRERQKGQTDLAGMGVAGKRQRDARRHLGKKIRLVQHQDHRGIVGHLRQRLRQIGEAGPVID